MKEFLYEIINDFTTGVDTYHHNGSMWLIFTDQKKWVIELTKDGTLWYNFYFFQDCFKYLSLDVVENQHYITEWVEDTIQNGVRSTDMSRSNIMLWVEDTIQNGVKNTLYVLSHDPGFVEDITQNGVKETKKIEHDRTTYHGYFNQERGSHTPLDTVQNVVENGIKETNWRKVDNFPEFEERVIKNGIKETMKCDVCLNLQVESTIQNGIRETKHGIHFFEDTTENVIKNGVKFES